jgi:hypothetical protein
MARHYRWNHGNFGKLIFGKELGCHANVCYTDDGKIDYNKTKIIMHETSQVDAGWETIRQFIEDQGFEAEIVTGDDKRPAINVRGGLNGPGCTIGIVDGHLGIFYLEQTIVPARDGGMAEIDLSLSSRKISLHAPDSLDTLAESLKELFEGELKHRYPAP